MKEEVAATALLDELSAIDAELARLSWKRPKKRHLALFFLLGFPAFRFLPPTTALLALLTPLAASFALRFLWKRWKQWRLRRQQDQIFERHEFVRALTPRGESAQTEVSVQVDTDG